MTSRPGDDPIVPDTRDWTFVLTDGCPECGYRPIDPAQTAESLRASIPLWHQALTRPDAAIRPLPTVWSPLEYACHVRDVCHVFGERLHLMLTQDAVQFPAWNQDEAARAGNYGAALPLAVAEQFASEAGAVADSYDQVSGDQWQRAGTRADGARFTVASLGQYLVHDITHHLHDVGALPGAAPNERTTA